VTTTKKKRLKTEEEKGEGKVKSTRIAGAITVDEEVLAQKAEEESTKPESKKEIKEMMDVEILPPGSKTPKVVDRVEVTLYYSETFEDYNLTAESAKKLERIRLKHLGRLTREDDVKQRGLVESAQYALHFALNEAEDDEKALEMANAALDFLNDYLKMEDGA